MKPLRFPPLVIGLAFIAAGLAGCTAAQEATVKKDVTAVLQDIGVRGDSLDEPGLTQAVAIVWSLYGRTDPAPRVLLVTGGALSCTDPNSGNLGFPVIMLDGPSCREGYTLLPFEVSVAYRAQPWSQSAVAHELYHEVLIRSLQGNPIGDPNHLTAGFKLGGLVDQANSALEAAGL